MVNPTKLTDLSVDTLQIAGVSVVTALLLASGQVLDLNGEAYGLVLDADANTAIGASVDDVINIKVGGAEDFRILANILRALSGSVIETNTINETTAASGVTIDGALIKDTAVYGRTPYLAVAVDAAVTIPVYNQVIGMTKAGVLALTIADPTTGTHDGVTITFVATTANANTVSNAAGSGFFSSGGGSKDIATFGGAIGDGFTIIAISGKWYIDPRGSTNITLG